MDINSNSNSNSNYSLGNSCPFDLPSFQSQSDHNPMNLFEVSGIYDSNILEEDNNIFLNNATISLNTKYNKNREKADVNYTKINIQGNNNQQIQNLSIENIKEINPENYKGNFGKFLKFIKEVETELKDQNKFEEEIEIDLKLTEEKKDDVTCEYIIKNKKFNENNFNDYDILNKCDYYGLYSMLTNMNGY